MKNDPKPALSAEAIRANIEYYQTLADKARLSHIEYLRARNVWRELLKNYEKTPENS